MALFFSFLSPAGKRIVTKNNGSFFRQAPTNIIIVVLVTIFPLLLSSLFFLGSNVVVGVSAQKLDMEIRSHCKICGDVTLYWLPPGDESNHPVSVGTVTVPENERMAVLPQNTFVSHRFILQQEVSSENYFTPKVYGPFEAIDDIIHIDKRGQVKMGKTLGRKHFRPFGFDDTSPFGVLNHLSLHPYFIEHLDMRKGEHTLHGIRYGPDLTEKLEQQVK